MSNIDVTILMPCLNEVRTLPVCISMAQEAIEMLRAKGLEGEILISDNGSTDGSVELARELGCRVTHCPLKGYGNALMHGCREARGKYIVMADSDGSYDFRQGVPMVEKLREGYDLCMGNRFKGGIAPGAMPALNRYFGNPAVTGILNVLFHTGLGDVQSGLRAFTKDAFHRMKLNSPGMEFASEMVVKASLKKMRTTEIPITLSPDGRGRAPHLRPWRDGWRNLRFLLLISPVWLFIFPALVILIASLLIQAFLVREGSGEMFTFGPFHMGDHWMVLAGGLFNLSFTAVAFGLISYRHSVAAGYRSPTGWPARLIDQFTLERGLIIGILLFLTGVGVIGYVVGVWYRADFGALARVREMVLGTTFLVTGLQVLFTAFVLALYHEKYRPYQLHSGISAAATQTQVSGTEPGDMAREEVGVRGQP